MKTKERPPVFFHRRMNDEPTVQVRGDDIERAIRLLRRRVQMCGALKALKIRKHHPSRKDRRRLKDRKAAQQFIRAAKIRGLKEID